MSTDIARLFNINTNFTKAELNYAYNIKINEIHQMHITAADKQVLLNYYTTIYNKSLYTNNFGNNNFGNTNFGNTNFGNTNFKSQSYSYSNQTNGDGTNIVRELKNINDNGNIKTIQVSYKIDKYGNKIII